MRDRGSLYSINISGGGVPKRPVNEAMITVHGVAGDRQNDQVHHGGPDRAVSLFSLERIQALRSEGHPLDAGTTGENLTVTGIDWDMVMPGRRMEIGEALLEIVSFTTPCRTIRESFMEHKFSRLSQKHHPGWSRVYARVLREGLVRVGDQVFIPGWKGVLRPLQIESAVIGPEGLAATPPPEELAPRNRGTTLE